MMSMASSMLMYCKEKGSAGIPSLTLEPAGLDRWCIKRSLQFFFWNGANARAVYKWEWGRVKWASRVAGVAGTGELCRHKCRVLEW